MYQRNVLWVLGFQLDSFIVKCVICKKASVGVARGMWWCCYCTWQHYCDILTFRNTCHDFVTAVSGGRHVHYVQADIAHVSLGGSWISSSSRWNSSDQFIATCISLYSVSAEHRSRWEPCQWHQTQVCEPSRVLKWAAGAVPGGLDKHLDCYLSLIWIWMGLVFAGISWMLTLRINPSFIEFALRCQRCCGRPPEMNKSNLPLPTDSNKLFHLAIQNLSIFTTVVYWVFFHCVFATTLNAKTS